MPQLRHSSGPPREGVILLVVVLMLALFLVVGLTFVLYAESAATGSRINREAQAPDVADVAPETLLNYALAQLIYGAPEDVNGSLSAMRGHDLARLAYGWNYQPMAGSLMPDPNKTNSRWDPTFGNLANTTPFNGIGPLRTLKSPVNGVNEYDMINYTWFATDGFVRDPERITTRTDPTQPTVGAFSGGFNVPYTYPDRTNLFLAAIQTTDPTQIDPTTHQPVILNPPRLIMPSFARPTAALPFVAANQNAMQIEPSTAGGQNFWTKNSSPALKYLTLRPRPADMYYAPNDPRSFPMPADFGGDVKNLPGVALTYTYTNAQGQQVTTQAQNDSFWMDLNYPVQISRNGRKYKPLFAFLVVDLDGKINLNVHGNVNAGQGTAQNPWQHASNQALGRHEINISKLLIAPSSTNANMLEWPQLFLGTGPTSTAAARYGPWYTANQPPVPGAFSAIPNQTNPNQYTDPYAGNWERSFVFPVDFDAIDPNPPALGGSPSPPRPLTMRFRLPGDYLSYTNGQPDPNHGFASFPQFGFGVPGQTPTGFDNYTYDQALNQPQLNPRLNHPLLNQKLRGINYTTVATANGPVTIQSISDDQPIGDDNLFPILAGDYRKSAVYGLIPNNLGGDGSNAQLTVLGNKVRQLITTRSYDLDSPGASPWVLDPILQGDYKLPNPNAQGQNNQVSPLSYPVGDPTGQANMVTPPPAQITTQPPTTDYKPGDGRANLLSRVDLARKLTPYTDPATGKFVPPVSGNQPLPQVPPNILYTQFPLASNPQYRYFYATYERQQLAKDIFDRLVKATGAVPPASTNPPGPGTLTAANGATPEHFAATRYLAQLAVNIVDFIDEDDVITSFQWNPYWNPAQDMQLAGRKRPDNTQEDPKMETGWVYGLEAPKVLINEAICELQNDPQDRQDPATYNPLGTRPTPPAKKPFVFSFWLELYNPTPADSTAPATLPSSRQDPDKTFGNKGNVIPHDHLAAQLERQSPTTGSTYPVYQVAILDDKTQPGLANTLTDAPNTDGWFNTAELTSACKILLSSLSFSGQPYQPAPGRDPGDPNYFDANFVEPTAGVFSTASPNPNQPPVLPKNQGFYVLAPDAQRDFVAANNNFQPTLRKTHSGNTPQQSQQMPWGQVQGGSAKNSMSYEDQSSQPNPPTNTLGLADANATSPARPPGRTHMVLLRRLACPQLDPNPFAPGTNTPLDPTKPFNPYITVDVMTHVPTNDAVQVLGSQPGSNKLDNGNKNYMQARERRSYMRRQPYAGGEKLMGRPQQGALPEPVTHTFFKHNETTQPQIGGNTPHLDTPFDWAVHLDRAPSNVMDVLLAPAVRPHMLTQQFIVGEAKFDPLGSVLQSLTENRHGHLAPWADQNSRLYRALEYFTVGDRSPYPSTLGRVAGKININTVFDRDIFDAAIDGRPPNNLSANPRVVNPNFFFENPPTSTTVATGAVTDVWQGKQSASLAQTLADPSNVSVRNRKQQILGLPGAGQPDNPFRSLATPVLPANVDPQYPTGSGIANTIMPYPGSSGTLIGTFAPLPNTNGQSSQTQPYQSVDYTRPQPAQNQMISPNAPPYVIDELLSKISGHVTPRSNNFAVFLTVGFFEVVNDQTFPVQLGAELTTSGGKPIRHQMFALVDRTNLAIDAGAALDPANPDPTGRLRQAPMPPVFMTLTDAIPAGTGAPPKQGQPASPITRGVNGGLPADYDGTAPVVFKPNPPAPYPAQNFLPISTAGWPSGMYQWMFLDTGATQEPVQVTQLIDQKTGTPTGQLLLLFPNGAQFNHPPGAVLCTYQPGNPGPQGMIDYTSPQYRAVVPYTYIVQ